MALESPKSMQIRPFKLETDDIEALTELLHKAYKQLADMELRYLATHQRIPTSLRKESKMAFALSG